MAEIGDIFLRGTHIPRGKKMALSRLTGTGDTLKWEVDVPLVTHPLMLAYLARVFIVAGLVVGGLLALLLAVTGSLESIVPMLERTAEATAGLAALALLASLAFFGNRMHVCFSLDKAGAETTISDRHVDGRRKAAIVLGLLTGRPGVVGAGLLAGSDAFRRVAWPSVARAHCHPHLRAVTLSNGWRTVMTLFCAPEDYDAVVATVQGAIAAHPAKAHHNPLPRLFLHSALIVLAALPLFQLPFVAGAGLIPAVLTLCIGLAALWLLPILAWSMPLWLGWLTVLEILALGKTHTSLFDHGTYIAYEVLNQGDLITLGLAVAGIGYLMWLSTGLVRGRIRSGLADEHDA